MDSLLTMDLEDLMKVKVSLASGVEEPLIGAPAAMVVVTARDIRQRGYTSLADVLTDLPGFDISVANGAWYMNAYQRGYRTPVTARTLLMIDGKVDNSLWSNVAHCSRQYPLTNVKRIEVLYGPASAVYGANAFLGIINIITRDGSDLNKGETAAVMSLQGGSYETRAVDASFRGREADLSYALSVRLFRSDEPDLSDEWGFLSNDKLGDRTIWGPILDIEVNGRELGEYYDPSDDYGIMGKIGYKDFELGITKWEIKEGYGAQYAADKGQVNGSWIRSSMQVFAEHEHNLFYDVSSHTLLLYRENRYRGDWAEASSDWNPGMEDYFYISFTYWNCDNNSWLLEQSFEITPMEDLSISAGLNYERKELTKAYDVPGYWGAFSSSVPAEDSGPYGYGFGIGHSTDSAYTIPPAPSSEMPSVNLTYTQDYGGFVQSILDVRQFRFNAGIRYDYNSVHGSSLNPRVSAIYRLSEKGALKLVYGEAFQEPPPIMLWGGWSGRNANPDLKPEKARNLEAIAMYRTGPLFHDFSVFGAYYDNVIKEEAENTGDRTIYGLEYRLKSSLPNFIPRTPDISAYLYYTYTYALSSIHYDHADGQWEHGEAELGDISPHKVNAGFNLPVGYGFNVFLSGNYVHEQLLYLRNPMRAEGKKLDSYLTVNSNIRYTYKQLSVSLKVLNLFDADYFHSGIDKADAGDDFTQRSLGWHNSVHPQPGRSYWVNLSSDF
ncbi:TonB-dependent receptor plug domain-containing protein [Fibrobacterota bacterium]